jgi:hypothetical protein
MEYYTNVGTMIESDDYFSIMLTNVWTLSGGSIPMMSYESVQNKFGNMDLGGN